MEGFYKIVTKAGGLVTFRHNAIQEILLQIVAYCWLFLIPCWILEPKSRQLGSSTWWQGFFATRMVLEQNFRCMLVAHEEQSATEIFQMTLLFEENLPDELKPPVKHRSKGELSLENGGKASVRTIGTGGGLGRGYTMKGFHGSETAFWRNRVDPWESWSAASQAIADVDDAVVGFESSPNGRDVFFHFLCDQALKRKNNWLPVFLPWYLNPTYSVSKEDYLLKCRDARLGGEVSFELTSEERSLVEEIKAQKVLPGEEWIRWPRELTLEQILWRRLTVVNKCKDDLEIFDREYPSTWERAFKAKENLFFGDKLIERLWGTCKEPGRIGRMDEDGDFDDEIDERELRKWSIKLWEPPKDGYEYVIGADVGEGLKDGDPSAAYVLRVDKKKQRARVVAALHGWLDPDLYAYQLYWLGLYYNTAKIGVEVNKIYITARVLVRLKYPSVYWHKDASNPRSKSRRPGWRTDDKTRLLALGILKRMARDGELEVLDSGLPYEMGDFVPGPKGKHEARRGKHDDRIIAAGIACFLTGLRDTRGARKKPRKPPGPSSSKERGYEIYKAEMERLKRMQRRGGGSTFYSMS